MENLKYTYNNFKLIEYAKYKVGNSYPLFLADEEKHYHFNDGELILLDYPLNVFKSKNIKILNKLKEAWDGKYRDFLSDVNGVDNYSNIYSLDDTYYLVLRNKEFKINEVDKIIFENVDANLFELGVFSIDEKLVQEIFELDQNLQSTESLELILELMEENTDMNKYIDFITQNIKKDDLKKSFFFDEYIYDLFAKIYVNSLKELAVYKKDPYGRKGIERFIDQTLKGVYNDECKCYNI